MKLNFDVDFKVGKFIKRFIVADMLLFSGWGFVDPIFSVFLIKEIPGATLVTVGIATAIYWVVKSPIQIPIAIFLDKTDGEKDDFYTLIAALFVIGLSSLGFSAATHVWHVYILSLFKAVGFGMYVPAWSSLFSRHLDKGHYSLDWSLDSTSVGLAIGATGFLSGIFATWIGYSSVFVICGLFSFFSAAVLLSVPSLVLPPGNRRRSVIPDHAPVDINQ